MNILPKVKIDHGRELAPGWVAIVRDLGTESYSIDTLLYIAPPSNVADAPAIAEAIVDAINAAVTRPHRGGAA